MSQELTAQTQASTPLNDALNEIGKRFGYDIRLMTDKWEDAPVSRHIFGVSLEAAIGELLRNFDHYFVKDSDGYLVYVLGLSSSEVGAVPIVDALEYRIGDSGASDEEWIILVDAEGEPEYLRVKDLPNPTTDESQWLEIQGENGEVEFIRTPSATSDDSQWLEIQGEDGQVEYIRKLPYPRHGMATASAAARPARGKW